MNIWSSIAIGMVVVIVVAAATFLGLGADRVWRFFGDPDLGNVTFETLRRRETPTDALACPRDFCAARAEIVSPLYPVPASELRTVFAKVIASEPRITALEADDATLTDRYVQRTARLGFPDTINVRFLDLPDGRSSLALYSRSRFGKDDFGENRARIQRWLGKLAVDMAGAK